MKLVVGLGNPGAQYDGTRHNVGFDAVDLLAERLGIVLTRRKFDTLCGDGRCGEHAVWLCKPQTYMNCSGIPVVAWHRFLKLELQDLLVVHDDLDLALGQMKFARDRGAAGHRGIVSVIESLGSQAFNRLRLGIGRPHTGADPAGYVLERFAQDEVATAEAMTQRGAEAIQAYLIDGLAKTMNRYHMKEEGI